MTEEEARELEEMVIYTQQIEAARKRILATGGVAGEIACKVCGGRIRFAVAPNGHVRASCSTEDCLQWIE